MGVDLVVRVYALDEFDADDLRTRGDIVRVALHPWVGDPGLRCDEYYDLDTCHPEPDPASVPLALRMPVRFHNARAPVAAAVEILKRLFPRGRVYVGDDSSSQLYEATPEFLAEWWDRVVRDLGDPDIRREYEAGLRAPSDKEPTP